ncbi:MAG: CPBP family intramembrane metalloprotease [Theionarchaea archaeon]|nr:CPBP family intramembrane metalloprotease [Theionarchaea archaeon]
MNKISLPTKCPFDIRSFIFIVILLIPAAYLILPYSLTISPTTLELLGLPLLLLVTLVNVAIYAVLAAIGLYLAGRIGLGLPFIEGWLKKESIRDQFWGVLAISVSIGVVTALIITALNGFVFGPPLQAELESSGVTIPESIQPPAWQGFLASISAAISEEVIFRLFGVTLLAFFGGLLFHDSEGRPHPAVLWVSIIFIAVVFGLAHLPTVALVGVPLTPLVITQAIVLNGVGGIAFGWLYWTRGLESAMIAHFSADIVLHVILVLLV